MYEPDPSHHGIPRDGSRVRPLIPRLLRPAATTSLRRAQRHRQMTDIRRGVLPAAADDGRESESEGSRECDASDASAGGRSVQRARRVH